MSYSQNDTICVYTKNEEVILQAEKFAAIHNMQLFIADIETDLIAIPFWLAVIDINLLKGEYLEFLKSVDEDPLIENRCEFFCVEEIGVTERIISHTKPKELPDWLSKYLIINENITLEILDDCCRDLLPQANSNPK